MPPEPSDIVGDQRFYSPELLRYITSDGSFDKRSLTTSSDIFSLGLLIHSAIVGELPRFDADRYQFACESVAAGQPLEVTGLSGKVEELVVAMVQDDHRARPNIARVIEVFAELTPEELGEIVRGSGGARRTVNPRVPGGTSGLGLKGTLGKPAATEAVAEAAAPTEDTRPVSTITEEPPTRSRLKSTVKPTGPEGNGASG
jgi:serine/threonine protein kinase